MFRSNLATYPYISHGPSYGQNLARATRGFVAALFAIEPELPEPAHEADVEQRDGIEEINVLASRFEDIMPNQAAELRYLAGTEPSEEVKPS